MLNLDKSKKYLLACSYGSDSMALLGMLKENGYNFVVANVNYNLRKESTSESEALKKYCEKHEIPLFYLGFASEFKGNIEKQCREIRYNFFSKLIKEESLDALLVGHHKDDHIETYLLQKKRNNIPTVFGLPYETEIYGIKVIRPLLDFDKKYLENYCKTHLIPYCVDSSNLQDIYERNKIRHQVVDKMSEAQKVEVCALIKNENANLEAMRNKLANIDLTVDSLKTLNVKELQMYLSLKAKEFGYSSRVSRKNAVEVQKLLESSKANLEVKLNNSVSLNLSYGEISFNKTNYEKYEFKMEKPDVLDNEFFFCDFSKEFSNRNVKLEDFPITIRTAEPQDVVQIKDYFVKVRRLFIDWKMPLKIRRKWPVIVNKDNKVIYIPRYTKRFVITDNINFYVK